MLRTKWHLAIWGNLWHDCYWLFVARFIICYLSHDLTSVSQHTSQRRFAALPRAEKRRNGMNPKHVLDSFEIAGTINHDPIVNLKMLKSTKYFPETRENWHEDEPRSPRKLASWMAARINACSERPVPWVTNSRYR